MTGQQRRKAGSRSRLLGAAVAGVTIAAALVWWMATSEAPAPAAWARLGTSDVHALSFDPTDPDRLLFGHHGGLLASSDGGRTWEPTGLRASDAMNVGRLGNERLQVAGHEVYMESTDGGATWSPVPNNLPGLDLHAFAVDPGNADRAWTFAAGHGLFRTENAGRDWELLDVNNWGALTAYRRDGVTVVAAIGPSGLVRSTDGGIAWEPIAYPGAPLAAMSAARDGSVLYAATAAGIRVSADEGKTWSDTGFTIQALALAVSPSEPGILAAVDEQTLFYRSFDGGSTWPAPPP